MSTAVPLGSTDGHLALDGTFNFRELDSFPAGPTHRIRPQKLYRSDALHRLNNHSRTAIADLRITTVLDLRTPEEVLHAPSTLNSLGVITHHHPIFLGSVLAMVDGDFTLATMYRAIVLEHGTELARALRLIANTGEGAVVVHCTAGKDRTGLVIALSLLAVGVEEHLVVTDYARTNGYLAGQWRDEMAATIESGGITITPALEELITGSPAELMQEMLRLIEATFGSVLAYLYAHGFTADDLALLRSTLTTTSAEFAPDLDPASDPAPPVTFREDHSA